MKQLNDFYKFRIGAHQKRSNNEDFLWILNKELSKVEYLRYRIDLQERPHLAVFGIPRSGTTLLTQILAKTFDIGYFNNISARFWLAPVMGIYLSKIILNGKKQINYESDFGDTKASSNIHGFGYFWNTWLQKWNIDGWTELTKTEALINWDEFRLTLLNIQHAFNKPMITKAIPAAHHMKSFINIMPKTLFIYIQRDTIDTIISILKARKAFYGDNGMRLWWSTIPSEYHKLKNLLSEEQVIGQVQYLQKFYEEQILSIPEKNIIKIQLYDLCKNPLAVVLYIQSIYKKLFGCNLIINHVLPKSFSFSYYSKKERAAVRGFEKFKEKINE